MELKLQLLGPPQIQVGSDPLDVDTRKATALLMYLTVTGEVQRRESMAAMFWPESDGPHAKAALRRTLSALRKALDGGWLQADRELVSAEADWLDCAAFSQLVEDTRKHGHPSDRACGRCIEPLTQAAQLYRGDFLEGFTLPDSPDFDHWQYFHTLAYQRQLAEGLQRLATAHQDRQEFELAAEYANRLLSLDPLNEAAHRMLMSIYAHSGQRQLALRQYQACVRVLQEELGAPPLSETVELNERIVAGELEGVVRAVGGAVVAGEREADGGQLAAQAQPEAPAPQVARVPLAAGGELDVRRVELPRPSATVGELPLVGRDRELGEMLAWYEGIAGEPRALVIGGELGIGKSRLATEFTHGLAARGARMLEARCYPDEATYAYRPWIDALRAGLKLPDAEQRLAGTPALWLAEAARLLPELRELFPELDRAEPPAGSGGQDRFLEALAQMTAGLLADRMPGVIFVDDLHWADEASLDLMTYLLRHGSEIPLLIVVGWRTEGLVGEQQLRTVLARFPQRRRLSVHLPRLTNEQVGALARQAGLTGSKLGDTLYRETEGLPFFVAEYLRAMERQGEGSAGDMPPSIRQAIEARLNALSGTGKQLLSTAAVIGRSFEYETLRMVSGRSAEETVAGIEELVGAGSIHEFRPSSLRLGPSYDFVHEKLREVALENTTQARQRLLHARTAVALTRLQGHRRAELLADRIAHHLWRSGDEPGAAEMYVQAGEHARSVYANEEALSHFRSALALGHADQAWLYESIGDLLTLTGRYDEAIQSYEAAEAMRPEAAVARIKHKLGSVHERWGRWEQAEHHFSAAAQAAESEAERARIHADWGLVAHRQGQVEQAERLIQQALEQAEAAGDLGALAQCHNILGILARAAGDAGTALRNLERSLDYADRLDDPGARSAALNNLALALAQDGQLEAALRAERHALEICQSLGDRHRAAALHSNLADLLHRTGDKQAAQQQLTRSAELFAAVGVEGGEFEPEIWKLVEW